MKKISVIFTFFILFFHCANGASVIATINGNPITDSDVSARTVLMAKQGKTSTNNRKQALQNIIDDYIKLDHAAKFNVKPTDNDANKEFKNMNLGEMDATTNAMARLAIRSQIAWQVIIARTIIPTIKISDSDIADEKAEIAREHGLPIEITLIRLTDIPVDISQKLNNPKNCELAEKMASDLGGIPQKITAMQYELSADIRERIANLPILTWSKNENNSVFLICSEKKTKEYKNMDEIIKQNAEYKKAMLIANQQIKQLRRKAVIIINDDRYKL